jgi:hypothetical protein
LPKNGKTGMTDERLPFSATRLCKWTPASFSDANFLAAELLVKNLAQYTAFFFRWQKVWDEKQKCGMNCRSDLRLQNGLTNFFRVVAGNRNRERGVPEL